MQASRSWKLNISETSEDFPRARNNRKLRCSGILFMKHSINGNKITNFSDRGLQIYGFQPRPFLIPVHFLCAWLVCLSDPRMPFLFITVIYLRIWQIRRPCGTLTRSIVRNFAFPNANDVQLQINNSRFTLTYYGTTDRTSDHVNDALDIHLKLNRLKLKICFYFVMEYDKPTRICFLKRLQL